MLPLPLLAALNAHPDLARLGQVPLEELSFTAAEQDVLRTYHPEQVLIVYGTLAPGRPNYPIIEPVGGRWQPGTVMGILEAQGWGADLGYPGFRPPGTLEATLIKAELLFSEQLVAHWARLDAFEGEGYRRILAPYTREDGSVGVGFIYALRDA